MDVFRINFEWNLFAEGQLVHWFRWLGAERATSQYMNQWRPGLLTHIYIRTLGFSWLIHIVLEYLLRLAYWSHMQVIRKMYFLGLISFWKREGHVSFYFYLLGWSILIRQIYGHVCQPVICILDVFYTNLWTPLGPGHGDTDNGMRPRAALGWSADKHWNGYVIVLAKVSPPAALRVVKHDNFRWNQRWNFHQYVDIFVSVKDDISSCQQNERSRNTPRFLLLNPNECKCRSS